MIDDQLNLDLTVNNAEIISTRPNHVKILEGLFKTSAKEESQYRMDQTLNLSIGMPTKTNIDEEIGGNTKRIFDNSALNFSNIYPERVETKVNEKAVVENVLSEVSIELESDIKEFRSEQPEIVVAQSNAFENSRCIDKNSMTPLQPQMESNVSIMNETKADTIVTLPAMTAEQKEKYEYYSSVAASVDFRSIEEHMLDVINTKKELKLRACKDWIEKKKGTCFKVTCDELLNGKDKMQEILEEIVFDNDPEDFLHYFFFSNLEERKDWDTQAAEMSILYVFEKDRTKYIFFRQVTKKVLMIKAREYIYCVALRKLETGDLIYAMQSYDDKNLSPDPNIERGRFEMGGGYIKFGEDRQITMTNKS